MATKIDKTAIELANIYEIRLKVDDSEKQIYTKEELLKFLDEAAKEIKAAEEG
ncbi:MAG: hypothetical protein IJ679_12385 [Lachnospiraceae bacterium]|nr:hypothetical protein [Lachnospiraceae bacterium]